MRTAFQRWCLVTAASALYFFLVEGGIFWGSPTADFVLRTRGGRRGWALACGAFALQLLPVVGVFAGSWFYEDLPDLRE